MENLYSATVDALERLQEERDSALEDGDVARYVELDEMISVY